MFGTIRRHQAWLWWVVGGLTIASFLVFGPTNTKLSNALRGAGNYGTVGGRPITLDELRNAQHEVTLRYFLINGQHWPDAKSDFNVSKEAYLRILMNEKEKELGIQISSATLAEFARHVLGPAPLDDFVTKVLKPEGLDAEDFERFLRHEAGLQQLITVTGLSGKLVTPQEAETVYREDHQELSCSMIFLNVSNYLSSVTVSNEALMQFYTNRMSVYREPARVVVSYVNYNITNYLAAAEKSLTNLDLSVNENVKHMGTNLFHGAKTPEESKAAIRKELIREAALTDARRDAGQFAEDLDQMQPRGAGNLEELAKKKNLKARVTAPFDQESGPQSMDLPLSFTAAFRLSPDDPFGGPIMAEDGVYVIALKQKLPSEIPPFKDIEKKVTDDFRYFEALQLLQKAGLKDVSLLTNGLAQGKTFDSVCALAGLKTELLPPFSLSTSSLPEAVEDWVEFSMLKRVAFSTPVGSVSQLARARDGAFILHVEKQLPVDVMKMKTDLPGFTAYMRQARQNDAFNQWFNAQIRQDQPFMAVLQKVSQESQVRPGTRPPRT